MSSSSFLATLDASMAGGLSTISVASASVFLCALISVGGGIGGGALYMPALMAIMGDAHKAVPVSKVAINGVAVSAFLFNVFRKHPRVNRPLIDLEISLLLEPLTLVGGMLGVYLNLYLSSTQILVCLVLVLSYTSLKTWQKARKQYDTESEVMSSAHQMEADIEIQPLNERSPPQRAAELAPDRIRQAQIDSQFSVGKFSALCVVWGVHSFVLWMVGGPEALMCGSLSQKASLWGLMLFLGGFTLVARCMVLHVQAKRDSVGEPNYTGVHYDSWNTFVYPFLSGFAGICAGCLGIGGGLIKGPLMLELGMHPLAATATSIFMILFTSSSTSLQFGLVGRLPLYPSVLFWGVSFLGGTLGSRVIARLLKKFKRPSLITYLLSSLIFLSMMSMAGITFYEEMTNEKNRNQLISDKTPESLCQRYEERSGSRDERKKVERESLKTHPHLLYPG